MFYEHLSLSLKDCLYQDVARGRWGDLVAGDFFLLFNDRLTALVHIVQLGHGFLTFQLRGLEFKGIYVCVCMCVCADCMCVRVFASCTAR